MRSERISSGHYSRFGREIQSAPVHGFVEDVAWTAPFDTSSTLASLHWSFNAVGSSMKTTLNKIMDLHSQR